MLVDCPNCARSYQVTAADLGARGRTLMCPRCATTWHQASEAPAARPIAVPVISARPMSALDEAPAPKRRSARRVLAGLGLSLAFAALLAAPAAAYVGRSAIVKSLPRTAALYALLGLDVNVYGLAIERLVPERTASGDVTIRGALRNVGEHRVGVPRLEFQVRDTENRLLVSWSESVASRPLPARHTLDFTSTPHRLPPEGRTVTATLN